MAVPMAAGDDDMKMDEKMSVELTSPESDLKSGQVAGLDQAEIFLRDNNFTHSDLTALLEDEEEIRKLVRRVDWTLMPLLCGTCKQAH